MARIVFKGGEIMIATMGYLDVMAKVRESQLIGRGFALLEVLTTEDGSDRKVERMAYVNINEIKGIFE